MISSMTAFGRTEVTDDIGHVIWEVRTVNHRYLDISLRLPEDLRILETAVREAISQRLSRGKVECSLRFEPAIDSESQIPINTPLAEALLAAAEEIATEATTSTLINPMDILRWPGVMASSIADPDQVTSPLLAQLEKTLERVVETRELEGKRLKQIILERCDSADEIIESTKKRLPEILEGLHERLLERTRELKLELEQDRLEQEIVLLTQKYDVAEEMDRLETHLAEVRRVLNQDEPVGRRLDFLMQELNREANTLGSKSAHYDCSKASVELKVLIEQMREQIQNIE